MDEEKKEKLLKEVDEITELINKKKARLLAISLELVDTLEGEQKKGLFKELVSFISKDV